MGVVCLCDGVVFWVLVVIVEFVYEDCGEVIEYFDVICGLFMWLGIEYV